MNINTQLRAILFKSIRFLIVKLIYKHFGINYFGIKNQLEKMISLTHA